MSKKERVIILIDGSNFYHYCKEFELTRLLEFDYKRFGEYLAHGREITSATYYIGKMREKVDDLQSRKLMANQQKLVGRLHNFGWKVSYGHILIDKGGQREKGVDVQIAVDLVVGAYEDIYDSALLISSDTDLIPAVRKVRNKGKKLEYVGFGHRPSHGLIKNATLTKTITKTDIEQFLPH